jgi:predicted permease
LGTILVAASWLQAVLYPVLALAPNVLALGATYAAILILSPAANAAVLSYRLALVPTDLQGRVNSAVRMIAYAAIPLGNLLAGLLLQIVTGTQALLLYASLMVTIAAGVTLNRHLRQEPLPRVGNATR